MADKYAETKRRYQKRYSKTPYYKFMHQRKGARARGVAWELSFEQWKAIWDASGKYEERGITGFQMCRKGDEGPYSIDNVYIAHQSQNKKDAFLNGKTKVPINTKIKLTIEQRREIYMKVHLRASVKTLAKQYGISTYHVYGIKHGRVSL